MAADQDDSPEPAARTIRGRLNAGWSGYRGIPVTVHAAALVFASVLLGFLLLYPTYYGFDEPQHVDRLYATTDGDLVPDPGKLLGSEGVARSESRFVRAWPYQSQHSLAHVDPIPRGARPSLVDLGGHGTDPPAGASNQMSQHPPGYFVLLGAVLWLVPGDASMPVDQMVAMLRLLNIALLLPLPYLLWWGTRKLTGDGPVAQAAAFVPILIPGLGRVGATVNNDNLLILASTALLGFVAGVSKGDLARRTAVWISGLLVVCLLTKGTALVLPLVVGAAYLVGWRRVHGPFPWRPALVVTTGAAIGGLWWLRNVLEFGAIQPDGFGNRAARVAGPMRLPDDPASFPVFAGYVQAYLPQRFWGGLGLIEPPALRGWLVTGLGVLLVGSVVMVLLVGRGNRIPLLILTAGAPIMLVAILQSSWSHFELYTIIQGVQGRYAYPFVLGIAAIIAIGVGAALRGLVRFTPLVILAIGLLTHAVAAYEIVRHFWLPLGASPRPGNLAAALDTIAAYAPWPAPVTLLLVLAVVGGTISATVIAARSVSRRSPSLAEG